MFHRQRKHRNRAGVTVNKKIERELHIKRLDDKIIGIKLVFREEILNIIIAIMPQPRLQEHTKQKFQENMDAVYKKTNGREELIT